MITGLIVKFFYILLYNIILALPESQGLPSGVADSIASMWGYLNSFSWLFPMSDLLTVLGISLGLEFAVFLFKVGSWVINKVRGSAS